MLRYGNEASFPMWINRAKSELTHDTIFEKKKNVNWCCPFFFAFVSRKEEEEEEKKKCDLQGLPRTPFHKTSEDLYFPTCLEGWNLIHCFSHDKVCFCASSTILEFKNSVQWLFAYFLDILSPQKKYVWHDEEGAIMAMLELMRHNCWMTILVTDHNWSELFKV